VTEATVDSSAEALEDVERGWFGPTQPGWTQGWLRRPDLVRSSSLATMRRRGFEQREVLEMAQRAIIGQRLDRGNERSQVQVDEVDVREGDRDVAADHHTGVECPVDEVDEGDLALALEPSPLAAHETGCASPTKL
jgi:hypothetical protein